MGPPYESLGLGFHMGLTYESLKGAVCKDSSDKQGEWDREHFAALERPERTGNTRKPAKPETYKAWDLEGGWGCGEMRGGRARGNARKTMDSAEQHWGSEFEMFQALVRNWAKVQWGDRIENEQKGEGQHSAEVSKAKDSSNPWEQLSISPGFWEWGLR